MQLSSLKKSTYFFSIGIISFWVILELAGRVGVDFALKRDSYSKFFEIKDQSTFILSKRKRPLRLSTNSDDHFLIWNKLDAYPAILKQSLIFHEDRRFYNHFGVDFIGVASALSSYTFSNARLRGASSITMQLARIHFGLKTNNLRGKITQMFSAFYLELLFSKNQLLEAYLNLAPMGRNILGYETASQIYFQRPTTKLAPEEILGLISIPQAPAKVNHRNKTSYLPLYHQKRASKLYQALINETQWENVNSFQMDKVQLFSIEQLPFLTPHFSDEVIYRYDKKGIVYSTIDLGIQERVEEQVEKYIKDNFKLGVSNAAIIVYNWSERELVAYVGSGDYFNRDISGQVNGTLSERSPGSTLKPFVYALGIDQGFLHPNTIVLDAPSIYHLPDNFDQNYLGAISATKALTLSRNIPAVLLSAKLRSPDFYQFLKNTGVEGLSSPDHYGKTLVLGSKELSLQDLVKYYAALAINGEYKDLRKFRDDKGSINSKDSKSNDPKIFSKEASILTKQMLAQTKLPNFSGKKFLKQSSDVFWKTGTSWGLRDAWTMGIQGEYVVGVWVGDFSGKTINKFIGLENAAPLFFNILEQLDSRKRRAKELWHNYSEKISSIKLCSVSGMRPNKYCSHTHHAAIVAGVTSIKKCNIHRPVLISSQTGKRACLESKGRTKVKVFEFWPSEITQIYTKLGLKMHAPPVFDSICTGQGKSSEGHPPKILYPKKSSEFMLSTDKKFGSFAFKASSELGSTKLFWYSGNAYLGASKPNEGIELTLAPGKHSLRVIDDLGRVSSRSIRVRYNY